MLPYYGQGECSEKSGMALMWNLGCSPCSMRLTEEFSEKHALHSRKRAAHDKQEFVLPQDFHTAIVRESILITKVKRI